MFYTLLLSSSAFIQFLPFRVREPECVGFIQVNLCTNRGVKCSGSALGGTKSNRFMLKARHAVASLFILSLKSIKSIIRGCRIISPSQSLHTCITPHSTPTLPFCTLMDTGMNKSGAGRRSPGLRESSPHTLLSGSFPIMHRGFTA